MQKVIFATAAILFQPAAFAAGACANVGEQFVQKLNRTFFDSVKQRRHDSYLLWYRVPINPVIIAQRPNEPALLAINDATEIESLRFSDDNLTDVAITASSSESQRMLERGFASRTSLPLASGTYVYVPMLAPISMKPFKLTDSVTLGVRKNTGMLACQFIIDQHDLGGRTITFSYDWRLSDSGRIVDSARPPNPLVDKALASFTAISGPLPGEPESDFARAYYRQVTTLFKAGVLARPSKLNELSKAVSAKFSEIVKQRHKDAAKQFLAEPALAAGSNSDMPPQAMPTPPSLPPGVE